MEEGGEGKGGGLGIPGFPIPPAPKAPGSVHVAVVPWDTMRAVPLGTSGTASACSAKENKSSRPIDFTGCCILHLLALWAGEPKMLGLQISPIPLLASELNVIELAIAFSLDQGGKG